MTLEHSSDYIQLENVQSTKRKDLIILQIKLDLASHAFSVAAPRTWNLLPYDLKSTETVPLFCKRLKTTNLACSTNIRYVFCTYDCIMHIDILRHCKCSFLTYEWGDQLKPFRIESVIQFSRSILFDNVLNFSLRSCILWGNALPPTSV